MEFNVKHTFTGSATSGNIQVDLQAESYNKNIPETVKVSAYGRADIELSDTIAPSVIEFSGTFNFKRMAFTNSTLQYGPAESVAVIENIVKSAYEELKQEIKRIYPE